MLTFKAIEPGIQFINVLIDIYHIIDQALCHRDYTNMYLAEMQWTSRLRTKNSIIQGSHKLFSCVEKHNAHYQVGRNVNNRATRQSTK